MGLFSKNQEEVVLCSPMEGKITFKGEPVKGARLERLIKWKDEVGEKDYVVTDDEGNFRFPIIKEMAELSPLSQFSVSQKIDVEHKVDKYRIWMMGKLDKHTYSELNGKPVNFSCDLTDPLVKIETEGGLLGTSCKWDSIEKITE